MACGSLRVDEVWRSDDPIRAILPLAVAERKKAAMIVKLRDNRYWIHGTVAGKFLRLPLGTSNENAAKVTVDHIERAWAEGATSLRWPELENILPPKTFDAVAKIGNYREPDPKAAAPPPKTWDDLERVFLARVGIAHPDQGQSRVNAGALSANVTRILGVPERNRCLRSAEHSHSVC